MQRLLRRLALVGVAALAGFVGSAPLAAQVTTASMRGAVMDDANMPLEGVRVEAVHTPSGTRYATLTRGDGRFALPGMRVGGPYEVAVTRIGFQRQSQTEVFLSLGTATELEFKMTQVATTISAVTVSGEAGIISPTRGCGHVRLSRAARTAAHDFAPHRRLHAPHTAGERHVVCRR